MSARPVSYQENNDVNGLALCTPRIFEEEIKKAQRLRDQQAEYLAGLPIDPHEANLAARKVLHHNSESYPEGFEEALHLFHALRSMITHLQTDDTGPDRDAFLWITDRIMFGLETASRRLDHMADILGNPGRIEREAEQ